MYILVLAIIIVFLIPLEIAFEPPYGHTAWWHIFEYVVEFFFVLDLLVTFNTTLYDSDGNEVFDRKHIAIDYLSESHFWFDIVSTVPLGVIYLSHNITMTIDKFHCKTTSHIESNQDYSTIKYHKEVERER